MKGLAGNSFCVVIVFLLPGSLALAEDGNLISNGSFEELSRDGTPVHWQFKSPDGYGKITISKDFSKSGKYSVCISTFVSGAKGVQLVYPELKLTPGWYRVRYSLKAPKGCVAVAQSWIGDGHSPHWHKITDQWSDIDYEVKIKKPSKSLIINPRYALPWTFYVDDVSVIRIDKPTKQKSASKVFSETIPEAKGQMRVLLFAPINIVDVADNINDWKQMGFRGFLVPYMPDDINDDIWAVDGDPNSRTPQTDRLWQEAKRFNDVCKANGIDSNFIKIGCYRMFPEWNDEIGWKIIIEKFRQNALFGKTSGFKGIAIDPEYIEPQLHAYLGDKARGIKIVNGRNNAVVAYENYGYKLCSAMLEVWPEMELIWIHDGPLYSSNLGSALFRSFLKALSERNASNGLHLFVEWTYRKTDPVWICQAVKDRRRWFAYYLKDKPLRDYWEQRCDIGIGLYPIGGGPSCNDWSDRRANYDVETFRKVLSAAGACGGKYTWVYGHGTNWFRVTRAKQVRYAKTAHPAYHNYKTDTGTLCPKIQNYYKVIRELSGEKQ